MTLEGRSHSCAKIRWPVRSRWKSQTIYIPHVAVLLILSLLTSTGSGKVVLGRRGRVASLLTLHSDVQRKWMPSHLSWVTNLSQSHPYIRRSWEEHPRCSASQQFTLFLEALGKCSVFQVSFFFFLTSLLEYNCFTMVCYFLLYNEVNQL